MLKKKIFFISVFTFFICLLVVLGAFVFKDIKNKIASNNSNKQIFEFVEKNKNSVFSINKITYFSSCNATTSVNGNSSFNVSNLYQYTDIAIFINNHANGNFTAQNTLKEVTISEIRYLLTPSIGTPNLYFKNINNFATSSFEENNIIKDNIKFDVSSSNEIDYSTKTLYNNCANPITLCYVNSNIKDNYTLHESISNISYDGSLLKNCNITLNSIACKMSFLITITNNLNEKYTCPIILNMPLSTENKTIYDGSLTLKSECDYNFIKE